MVEPAARVYLISVPNHRTNPPQGFEELLGSVRGQTGLPQLPARLLCRAGSVLHHGHPRQPAAPGGSRQPVPWVPHGCSPQDVLQQERRCLCQDLLQPLLLPSAERSQDIAGHRHVTLWPPDTNPEPGHLLGRKRESLRSFISRAEAELEQEDSAAKGAGQRGSSSSCFPGGFECLFQET